MRVRRVTLRKCTTGLLHGWFNAHGVEGTVRVSF
jgi:hypothetical protein